MVAQPPPQPHDESLHALLIELRRAALIQVDAYNRYLGEAPREPRPPHPRRQQEARVWRADDAPERQTA